MGCARSKLLEVESSSDEPDPVSGLRLPQLVHRGLELKCLSEQQELWEYNMERRARRPHRSSAAPRPAPQEVAPRLAWQPSPGKLAAHAPPTKGSAADGLAELLWLLLPWLPLGDLINLALVGRAGAAAVASIDDHDWLALASRFIAAVLARPRNPLEAAVHHLRSCHSPQPDREQVELFAAAAFSVVARNGRTARYQRSALGSPLDIEAGSWTEEVFHRTDPTLDSWRNCRAYQGLAMAHSMAQRRGDWWVRSAWPDLGQISGLCALRLSGHPEPGLTDLVIDPLWKRIPARVLARLVLFAAPAESTWIVASAASCNGSAESTPELVQQSCRPAESGISVELAVRLSNDVILIDNRFSTYRTPSNAEVLWIEETQQSEDLGFTIDLEILRDDFISRRLHTQSLSLHSSADWETDVQEALVEQQAEAKARAERLREMCSKARKHLLERSPACDAG